jgi:O-antigen ligase
MNAAPSAIHTASLTIERVRHIIVMLIAAALPVDIFFSTTLIYTLLVLCIIDLRRSDFSRIPRKFWIFQAVFYIGVLGYSYSLHKGNASALLERQLTIFLFPLVLPLALRFTKDEVHGILWALTISCTLIVIYLLLHMVYVITRELYLPVWSTISSGIFFNHAFSRPVGIHAGYLSLYIAFCITFVVSRFHAASTPRKMRLGASLLVLTIGLFFLASRNTLIAMLFVLLIIYPFFSLQYKWRSVLITVVCLIGCTIAIVKVPYLRERFSKQLVTDLGSRSHERTTISYGSAEPRIERWKGAALLISRSPAIGYGTGDEIPMLKTEYIRRGLFISYMEELNAHNQYLSYALKNGIAGLVLFLAAFIFYLWLAFSTRLFIYVSFIVLLMIGFYTENILDANKGIVFFALFNTVLGYHALSLRRPSIEMTSGNASGS